MNLMKDRSRCETVLFAMTVLGVWLFIWAVWLTSLPLGIVAFLTTLVPLIIFALRDS